MLDRVFSRRGKPITRQRTFGRRIDPHRLVADASEAVEFALPAKAAERSEIPAEQFFASTAADDSPSIDDELREWKRTRHVKIPWGPLSLMASLCFGIGSFVLPDSVNSGAQWLLWGLTAATLYTWFVNRRAKARARAAA